MVVLYMVVAQMINNMKLLRYFIVFPFLFSSCSKENIEEHSIVERIDVTIAPLHNDAITRSSVIMNSSADYNIYLNRQDTLGFFSFDKTNSKQQAYQMAFAVTQDDVQSFAFTGGGWSMSSDYTYQAYTPFNYSNMKASEIPVKMSGQKQDGNGGSGYKYNHLKSSLYMVSKKASPINGSLNVTMTPITCTVRMVVTAPATATYKKIVMMSDNNDFITETTYNLETAQYNSPIKTSKTHTLSLENISVNVGETMYLCTCIVPTRISSSTWKIALVDQNGKTYVCPMEKYKGYEQGGNKDLSLSNFTEQSITIPEGEETPDGITGTAPDFVSVSGISSHFD